MARRQMTDHHTDARLTTSVVRGDGTADIVAVELPLEIRLGGEPLAVTMRTPGHDAELALGFLLGEGLISEPAPAGPTMNFEANIIEVDASPLREPSPRRFYTSSSCGICGKGALEEVAVIAPSLPAGPVVDRRLLASLPERMTSSQRGFELSGGLHAAALFSQDGELLVVREDVGRHNALDKVIGNALAARLVPLGGLILCVSGRLSFELVQKAVVAGCPILVGVGAPSSLAVELAADRRLTLAGFARDGRVNVYTGDARVPAGE